MQLTKSQCITVSKIFKLYLNKQNTKYVSFKAPTGSGKTLMASELISKIFSEELGKNIKTVIVFATISNAELPKQLTKKLNSYKLFHEFNNYKIEFIQSPSASFKGREDIKEFFLEDNKVFVFGVSSFGKNTLFYKNRTLDNFILEAKNQNYQIIFIRDEAHIGKKENISKEMLINFDQKMKDGSSFVLEMTATPKSLENFIELTRFDMEDDGVFLLKEKEIIPPKFDVEMTNEEIINHAIETFLKSKKKYQEEIQDVVIYPAMLVQIMNQSDYEKDPEKNRLFKEGLELLEKKLTQNGLKYLKYLDSSPIVIGTNVPATLEYAAKLDSHIDVIIFKVGPATGWDIPRANMLLQLRNVSSENLNIQTLGRIMRNPMPSLEKNIITNEYFLYSNYQKSTRELASYILKKEFKKKEIFKGKIDIKDRTIILNNDKYREEVINYIRSNEFINLVKDITEDKIVYSSLDSKFSISSNKIENYVSLKIFNIKKFNEIDYSFSASSFVEYLEEISKKTKINIEKVKYVFSNNSIISIKDIKNKNSDWIKSEAPYNMTKDAKLSQNYSIWIDNNDPKKVSTSYFENYGYLLVSENKKNSNIQYLDSRPEEKFFNNFIKVIEKKSFVVDLKDIKFFAKMPTLGSGVYFEYYSKSESSIKKSFMDFAIEYKDQIIMVEVKSEDSDYDPSKTQDLLDAYEIYMNKYADKKINLVLYQYNRNTNGNNLYLMVKNKWEKNCSFTDALNYLFRKYDSFD